MTIMLPLIKDAQMRMTRYYIRRLREINILHQQGGDNIRHAVDQFDAESNQIEHTLAWLEDHSQDDAEIEKLFVAMLLAGRGVFKERLTIEQLLRLYQKGLAYVEKQADLQKRLICLDEIAQIHIDLSQFEPAYDYLHQLYTLAEATGQPLETAEGMYSLGFVCSADGRDAEAKTWLQNATTFYLETKNSERLVDCYTVLARGALQLGEWQQSEEYLNLAFAILDKTHNANQRLPALQVMGDLRERTGDKEGVMQYRLEVLALAEAHASRRDIVYAHVSLAIAYDIHMRFAEAQEHYREALRIANEMGLYRLRLLIWGNLGYSHYLQGDYALARDYTEKTLQVLLDEQSHYLACITMANLSAIYVQLGELPEAQQVVQQGSELALELENPQLQVMMTVAAVQYRVALAQSQLEPHHDSLTTAVQWAGFVYQAAQAEAENRGELDKLRPQMIALLDEKAVEVLLEQGAKLQLEAIVDDILQRL